MCLVALQGVDFQLGPIKSATSFPEPIGLASSFDRALIQDVATAISTEARAMSNTGQAGLTFFTPNINLFRDPRWGRGQETPGEDPFLTSEYVFALMNGLQGGEDERYLKLVADCKHYAAYDLENWGGVDRVHFDAIVSDQDMAESYLPAFETCIRDAKVASIMCSYNSVNGIPSCANDLLLKEIARGDWGLDGFVVSDCGAISDILHDHNYTTSVEETVAVAMLAGTDLNCGQFYQSFTQQALDAGTIIEADIDQALTRSMSTLFRAGWFDPADMQPYRQIGPEAVNTKETQALALEAAQSGMVLLERNLHFGSLPWNASNATVAVIGPFFNATDVQQGNYFGQAPFLTTPLDSLRAAGFKVLSAQGCMVNGTIKNGFAQALEVAQEADFVLFVGGITQKQEREGRDRVVISLPQVQMDLLQLLSASVIKPITAAFFSGGQVDMSFLKPANTNVSNVIWMGYPGEQGGTALANLITGKFSPAGRLVTTQYPADYVHQVSMFDMSFRPSATNPGRTYRFFPPEQAVYEFGYGLSYTTFEYVWLNEAGALFPTEDDELSTQQVSIASLYAAHKQHRATTAINYRVNVTNSGSDFTSDVVVQLFTMPPIPSPSDPLKQLIGFARVYDLAPGATEQVRFGIQARQLAHVDARGRKWLRPGKIVLGVDVPTKKVHVLELTGLAMRLR